ncbi:MAG: xanthine dehydrogenase family protein subunit M [Deltaproteobacteria bacterium]|nr:xanthine dehydrogenase family protein subunit M [Deltaproteobacteria bacterium]
MHPASFGYQAPGSLQEAFALLQEHGEDAKVLAGGHSLLPAMKLRLTQPEVLVDLRRIPGLDGIRVDNDTLVIGALTTHTEVGTSEDVRRLLPGLADTASVIGDLQVRNRGTMGGSVAHADPAADLPVTLTALDASFVLASAAGERIVTADDFFVDFFTTAVEPDEILTAIRIPLPSTPARTSYAKLPHPASGYVVVSAAAALTVDEAGACTGARVVLGGVAGTPHRATGAEAALTGQALTPEVMAAAAEQAADGIDPHADSYADEDYKRHMTVVYTRRAIEAAAARG